eukprot:2620550-Pleurochrysis_carterae.AAC.1
MVHEDVARRRQVKLALALVEPRQPPGKAADDVAVGVRQRVARGVVLCEDEVIAQLTTKALELVRVAAFENVLDSCSLLAALRVALVVGVEKLVDALRVNGAIVVVDIDFSHRL